MVSGGETCWEAGVFGGEGGSCGAAAIEADDGFRKKRPGEVRVGEPDCLLEAELVERKRELRGR